MALYIHWPFCKSKCPYCDFNSHVRERIDQEQWREALLKELEHMASVVPGRTVSSIFFGGGTPSTMSPSTAEALIARAHQLWQISGDAEITLEANPTSVEAHTFPDFKRAGINRVSLGVQSLSDEALRFLGRGHSVKEALTAVESAARTFARYSFDLIYARPQQTPADWEKELGEALRYARGHLSLYQLTIEESTAFHHAYAHKQFALPDEETAEALYRFTEAATAAAGLTAYEVSNYAAPGQESRHNLAYWLGRDYVGIGPGAHGRISMNGSRVASQTVKSPERWLESVTKYGHGIEIWEAIDRKREAEERLMMGLRLKQGIFYSAFKAQTGYDLNNYLNPKKRAFYISQGLLENRNDRLQATLKGRLVLNTLTAELLA